MSYGVFGFWFVCCWVCGFVVLEFVVLWVCGSGGLWFLVFVVLGLWFFLGFPRRILTLTTVSKKRPVTRNYFP